MKQRHSLYCIVYALVICVVVLLQVMSNVELSSISMTGVESSNKQRTHTDKTTSDSFHRLHQNTSRPFRDSKTKFVFFMGLEGTGHHLIGDMIDKSPLKASLEEWKVVPSHTVALGKALALEKTLHTTTMYSGLFNRHCYPSPQKGSKAASAQKRQIKHDGDDDQDDSTHTALNTSEDNSRRRRIRRQLTQVSSSRASLNRKFGQNGSDRITAELLAKLAQSKQQLDTKDPQIDVIEQLQQMEQIIEKQREGTAATNSSSHVFVPINTWRRHGFELVGQLSYPNMRGLECRKLNYPNIDLLYNACDVAKVDCVHAYLYREPHAVLRSTIGNRDMNTGVIQTIHLYISHLSILYAQLSRHASRTVGCFGFLDSTSTSHDPEQQEKHELENKRQERNWNIFKDMLGFNNNIDGESEFASIRNEFFKPPTPISEEMKRNMIPSDLQVYMDVLVQLYEDVRELCHEIVETQGSFDQ